MRLALTLLCGLLAGGVALGLTVALVSSTKLLEGSDRGFFSGLGLMALAFPAGVLLGVWKAPTGLDEASRRNALIGSFIVLLLALSGLGFWAVYR
ncbi:MAG TPA: hypothetical protein VGO93_02805 [Candidatus Xenobia bacterium]